MPSRALVSAGGYTRRIATRHPRIQVPRDPVLDAAIERARALAGPGVPASQIVRDLALRGVEAIEVEHAAASDAAGFLVDVAEGRSGLGLDALRTVRSRAWR
ncbi:MAG: hypothetical protein WEB79_04300 [Thermoleophilaceae bacterium]